MNEIFVGYSNKPYTKKVIIIIKISLAINIYINQKQAIGFTRLDLDKQKF